MLIPAKQASSTGNGASVRTPVPELFDHIDNPVVVSDLHGSIVYVNPAFSQSLRLENGDPVMSSLRELLAGTQLRTQHNFMLDVAGNERYQVHIFFTAGQKPRMEQTLKSLQQITSNPQLTFDQRVQKILELGREHFGLPIGCVSRVEGDLYTVTHILAPNNDIKPGMTFDLADTYCKHIIETDRPISFHEFSKTHSQLHSCFVHFGLEDFIGAPIYVDGERVGTITFSSPRPLKPFGARDLEVIDLFSGWLGHELARQRDMQSLEAARKELERWASEDPLTGLMNRRRIEIWAKTEYSRAIRHDFPIAIGLVDVDNFKALNDDFGHETGDQVLRAFADICHEEMRSEDAVARWGGEEFLFLFTHSSIEQAETVLKRIANRFRRLTLDTSLPPHPLTFSAGVLEVDLNQPFTKAISAADVGLYQAKHSGKDRILRCYASQESS